MAGRLVPLVLLPRFTSFAEGIFQTVPMDVSDFQRAIVTVWRGPVPTDSVVTFTCTIPIAATILGVSTGQHRLAALFAMLSYSSTMALPFFLLGLFPALIKEVPKSGGWLETVKVAKG